jgi:hypothetical protein
MGARPQQAAVKPRTSLILAQPVRLQRKARNSESEVRNDSSAPFIVHEVLSSPGQPLDAAIRTFMESRFGHDFSAVRVHTDATAAKSARAVSALAYTVGSDVVFAEGQYTAGTAAGQRLLAHELVHTIQQSDGRTPKGIASRSCDIGKVKDALEEEADQIADNISSGTNVPAFSVSHRTSFRANRLLQRQSKTGQQPTTTVQGDVPGENPETLYSEGADEIRIDGDGDQRKELVLRMTEEEFWPSSDPTGVGPVKRFLLKIVQISSGQARQVDVSLPKPTFGGQLFPIVQEVTDGRGPTRISLVTNTTNQWLEIYPPGRTATGVDYLVDAVGQRFSFQFPPEQSEIHKIAAPVDTPHVTGGILFVEVSLGAYNDSFGVTVRPISQTKAQLGISALSGGEPVDTRGAELQIDGQVRYHVMDTGPVTFGLDLDGDDTPDLIVFDQLTTPKEYNGGGPPEKNRNHRLRVTGKAVGTEQFFDFQVRDGYPVRGNLNPEGADKIAESNALAVHGLAAQAKEGAFQSQLDSAEFELMKVRQRAADNGVIWKQTFETWQSLSTAMIRLQAQKKQVVDAALQEEAARSARAFFESLAQETIVKARNTFTQAGNTFSNPYTGELTTAFPGATRTTGGGPSLERDIRAGRLSGALVDYQELVAGLDRWIVDQLTIKRGAGEAREAERLGAVKQNLRDIESHTPTRILAVFHPDEKFKTETGYIAELPLSLYYWREGDTWHLKDLTNPSKTFEYTADVVAGEPEPSPLLLGKLNDPDHFPVGVVHFEIPGRYSGTVPTQDYLTWKKFLAYFSLGLAAVGTILTFGTGTVAVAGAWALGASAVLGALSAGVDLAEHVQQGNLDTTTAVLDLAQLVGNLAGAGSLASGAIIRSAATAPATSRFAGAWAKTAMLANHVYLPVTKVTAAADVVTFAVVLPGTVKQLENIQNGTGDQTDKDRAKMLLLTQLAVLGGLSALSAKGLIADTAKLPTLVLTQGPEGVPVVSTALTEKSIVLDTNIVAAFEIRATDPTKLHEGHKSRIKQIEAMTDADLRVADPTISTEKARKGVPVTQKGIGVAVDRSSTEYQSFVTNLADAKDPVGGAKGSIDRAIIADTAFAVTEPGVKPRFATSDAGIYKPLARRANNPKKPGEKINPAKLGESVPDAFKDGFDVTINAKTIRVIPLK